MLSYNQVVKRLRSLSLSHKQIDHFFQGDPWEFTANGEVNYAALFLETLPGLFNRSERQIRYNFKVHLLDLVNVSEDTEGNEQEVVSDMMSVAADFLALIGSDEWDDWVIELTSSFTPVTEVTDDMCAGVVLDLSINIDWIPDACQVPRDSIVSEDGFDLITEQGEIIITE